jgi:hypothetical protein
MKFSLWKENPANHGLAARVWECLRCNTEFRDALKNLRAGAPGQARVEDEVFNHRFAAEVWTGIKRSDLKNADLNHYWTDLPVEFRRAFSELANGRPMPVEIRPPPWSRNDNLTSESMRRAVLSWLRQNIGRWAESTVLSLPQRTYDKPHRDAVLFTVGREIGKPIYHRKKRGNKSAVLGTKEQWEAYLQIKAEKAKGLADIPARKAACARLYGPKRFGSFCTHLRNSEREIERMISSAYPNDPLF